MPIITQEAHSRKQSKHIENVLRNVYIYSLRYNNTGYNDYRQTHMLLS